MSRNLYIATSEANSGKSLIVLGTMELLSRRVQRLGFFRPIVRSSKRRDNDTELILGRYNLPQEFDDSYGATYDEALDVAGQRGVAELIKRVLERYKKLEAECDFVLIEGTDFSGVASAFEFDFNAEAANNLRSPILNVVSGRGRSAEDALETAVASRRGFLEQRCSVAATAVNRIRPDSLDEVRDQFSRHWTFDDPVYWLEDEPSLESPTIRAVAESLLAAQLGDGELDLDREVLHIAVAAMQLPNFLDRLRDGTLVIAAGDRADILLGSLATVASENYPQICGIVLTGGLRPAEPVMRLIEGFRHPPVPILAVETDTFETVRDVMSIEGTISPGSERKIHAALRLFESSVDADELESWINVSRSATVTPMMFEYELIEQAKRNKQRIVLPEGEVERILRASEILRRRDVCDITLLGSVEKIRNTASRLGIQLGDIEIIDPETSEHTERFAEKYHELRQHKGVNLDAARDAVQDVSCFGTMMVYEGLAGGMVSGAAHTTAHTIRPALQVIRTRPGCKVVSSVFFMCLKDRVLVYGDCAVNPNPNPEQLADIAVTSATTARTFGIEPRVAMLSYSTGGSGEGKDVDKVKEATRLVREAQPELPIEGPIQYDAAIDAGVAETKLPESEVAGRATVFIFPDLNTGNNTYKAVQRSAGAVAIGPVMQGLNAPVNDLSRGCTVTDIVNTVAITAIQAQRREEEF